MAPVSAASELSRSYEPVRRLVACAASGGRLAPPPGPGTQRAGRQGPCCWRSEPRCWCRRRRSRRRSGHRAARCSRPSSGAWSTPDASPAILPAASTTIAVASGLGRALSGPGAGPRLGLVRGEVQPEAAVGALLLEQEGGRIGGAGRSRPWPAPAPRTPGRGRWRSRRGNAAFVLDPAGDRRRRATRPSRRRTGRLLPLEARVTRGLTVWKRARALASGTRRRRAGHEGPRRTSSRVRARLIVSAMLSVTARPRRRRADRTRSVDARPTSSSRTGCPCRTAVSWPASHVAPPVATPIGSWARWPGPG